MATLSTRTDVGRDVLRRLADERLAEFETLRTASPPHHAGALYLAGYAVEALLKCAICQALNLDELPVVFHVHDLQVLLFFSGRYREMQADTAVLDSFGRICTAWSETGRYTDPQTVGAQDCSRLDVWLNGAAVGVIPWLKARL